MASVIFWAVGHPCLRPVLTCVSLVMSKTGYDEHQTMFYGAPSGAVQILYLGRNSGMLPIPQ